MAFPIVQSKSKVAAETFDLRAYVSELILGLASLFCANTMRYQIITILTVIIAYSPLLAKEMECTYDFTVFTQTVKFKENPADLSLLPYTVRTVYPDQSKENDNRLKPEVKAGGPYKKMWDNMYYNASGYIPNVSFISFETVTYRSIQFPERYLQEFDALVHEDTGYNIYAKVPIMEWDCRRLD